MRTIGTVLAGALALGAATLAYADGKLQPGEWEMTMTMEMEGMPPGMMQPRTMRKCVTPDQAGKPEDFVKPQDQRNPGECELVNKKIHGNKLSADIACKTRGKGHVDMTFNKGSYQAVTEMQLVDRSGNARHAKTTVTGKRVGECSAAE